MTKPKTTDKLPCVFRGGSWVFTNPAVVRAANRNTYTPSLRSSYVVGFRCALRGREPVRA